MASVDTRVSDHSRMSFRVIELSVLLLILGSADGHLAYDLAKSEPWIPIARSDIAFRNKNNYHLSTRHHSQHDWRPTQEILIRNYNAVKENINVSVKSDETGFSAANIVTTISPQYTIESASLDEIIQDSNAFNITLQEDPEPDTIKLLPNSLNYIRKPRFQNQAIDSPNQINKQQMKLASDNAIPNEETQKLEIQKTDTLKNFSNIITNMYEVTENNNATNDLIIEETIAKESTGYSYEKPLLELKDEPKINTNKTNLTSNFWNILAKYKINANDDMKNYELSRDAVLNSQKGNSYRLLIPLRAYRVPSVHRIQTNEPLDRLFALFLSNYGYYLPQFYRIHGGYRNLYGHLAYNNMHGSANIYCMFTLFIA